MKAAPHWWPLPIIALAMAMLVAVYIVAHDPKLRGCLPFVGAEGDCGRITEIVAASEDLNWTPRHTGDRLDSLYAVTYADQQFVAVGARGLVASSPDGVTWETRNVAPGVSLRSVTFGDGVWVAVSSDRSMIFTSPDTTTWTAHEIDGHPSFSAVAYGNGRFVAVGLGGNYVSDDAVNWTRAYGDDILDGVIWDGQQFRATGNNRTVATSSHGLRYVRQPVETWLFRLVFTRTDHNFRSMARGPSRYVVVGGDHDSGNILVSEDGQHWRRRLWVNQTMNRVIYADDEFVAVADQWLLTSSDGLNWTTYRIPGFTAYDVAWGNGRYVLVGDGAQVFTSR